MSASRTLVSNPSTDQVQHRGLEEDRIPEIAPGDSLKPLQVLGRQRLVQTHLDPQRGDVLRRRLIAEHDRGGVARDEPHEDEDQERRRQKGRQERSEPADQIANHYGQPEGRLPPVPLDAEWT